MTLCIDQDMLKMILQIPASLGWQDKAGVSVDFSLKYELLAWWPHTLLEAAMEVQGCFHIL